MPLGGYCAFEGEDEENASPDAFNSKKPWQRILVLIAGATMNFLLALIIIILMFACYGREAIKLPKIANTSYVYTLQDNDTLLEVNGRKIFFYLDDLEKELAGKKQGSVVKFKVLRNGKVVNQKVELRSDVLPKNSAGMGASILRAIGVEDTYVGIKKANSPLGKGEFFLYYSASGSAENLTRIYNNNQLIEALNSSFDANNNAVFYTQSIADKTLTLSSPITISKPDNWENIKSSGNALQEVLKADSFYMWMQDTHYKASFFGVIGDSFVYAFKLGGVILESLGELLTGKLSIKEMGGPVTTVKTTSQVIAFGFEYFLKIVAFIGVNLAVFNMLPVPALDGSRVVFNLIEWIFKKPVPKKIEAIIHGVGIIVLLGFSILVDILQFV